MLPTRRSHIFFTLPLAFLSILCYSKTALAQIIPDRTLGTESSTVTPDNINDIPSDRIDGGAIRGANLFHSLREFNIGEGRGAYFSNPAGILNILTRVTGGNASNILGTLGVLGNANLFVINPNGISFGPNARLDLRGSFLASSASSLLFDNGFEFSATNSEAPPLLTVNIPIGLRFRENPGNLVNQSIAVDSNFNPVGLAVESGKTLALVGGNISLEGGILLAPGGRIELGGLTAAGTVGLNSNGSLSFPEGIARSDVFMSDRAEVNVRAGNGGSIAINARNLEILTESKVRAGIDSDLGSPNSKAGNIDINATETITLADESFISNAVLDRAIGKGGNVNITTGSLFLNTEALIRADTFGRGDGGSININATKAITMADGTFITSGVFPGAIGNAGNINVNAGSLSATNGARLVASTDGEGNAGNVNITARDRVLFDGENSDRFSGAFSVVGDSEGVKGNGGSININTGSLSVTNGARLNADTFGEGNAGSVNIIARDRVSFDGESRNSFSDPVDRMSAASITVKPGAVGNGGSINITADALSVTNGARLAASTLGEGNAGSVNIIAGDRISFDGVSDGLPSAAFSTVGEGAVGNGGGINITTGSLFVTNGARLQSSTLAQGNAGTIVISARDTVSFNGVSNNSFALRSAALSTVEQGVGNGGGLKITAGSVAIAKGAQLSATSETIGTAGSIQIQANSIRLEDGANLSSNTAGGEGNINLSGLDLILRRNSSIATNATGTATGGNITINVENLVALENSDIKANAEESFGGQVSINVRGIFGTEFRQQATPKSDITATSKLGASFSGTVEINTPDVDPSSGLVTLPQNVVDVTSLIAQNPCSRGTESAFIITGKGGLPPNPAEPLTPTAVVVDWATLSRTEQFSEGIREEFLPNSQPSIPDSIVPARGWVFNDKGEVVLTSNDPSGTEMLRLRANPPACESPSKSSKSD